MYTYTPSLVDLPPSSALYPNSAGSPVDPTPCQRPPPRVLACPPPTHSSSPPGRTLSTVSYRRIWVTGALEPPRASRRSTKGRGDSRGEREVPGEARKTLSFSGRTAGHRRPTRDRPFRIELPRATIRGFTQSGAVTEVGVAWNAARPANRRAARRGLGPGAVLRPGRAGCCPRPGLTGEHAGRFAPPAQTRPGHHFSVCRPKGEPQRLAGNVHRLFVNTLSLPYLRRMGRNQGQAQSSLALFQNAGLNKKNQAPPSENSLDPCGGRHSSGLHFGPGALQTVPTPRPLLSLWRCCCCCC